MKDNFNLNRMNYGRKYVEKLQQRNIIKDNPSGPKLAKNVHNAVSRNTRNPR